MDIFYFHSIWGQYIFGYIYYVDFNFLKIKHKFK